MTKENQYHDYMTRQGGQIRLVTEAERELKKIGVSLEDTEQKADKESDRE